MKTSTRQPPAHRPHHPDFSLVRAPPPPSDAQIGSRRQPKDDQPTAINKLIIHLQITLHLGIHHPITTRDPGIPGQSFALPQFHFRPFPFHKSFLSIAANNNLIIYFFHSFTTTIIPTHPQHHLPSSTLHFIVLLLLPHYIIHIDPLILPSYLAQSDLY